MSNCANLFFKRLVFPILHSKVHILHRFLTILHRHASACLKLLEALGVGGHSVCKGGSCNSFRSPTVKYMGCGDGDDDGDGNGCCVGGGGVVFGGGGQEKNHRNQ